MISLNKKNFNQYKELLIKLYKENNGNLNAVLRALPENNLISSKTSLCRLVKEFNIKNEVSLDKSIYFLIKEFLKNLSCEEKTVKEIRDLINQNFEINYNIHDVYSVLRNLNLSYKKKDLSKKCYSNSKRVSSKYEYCFDIIKNSLHLPNSEILNKLKENNFKDTEGNDFNLLKLQHIKRYLLKNETPRGQKKIESFVKKYDYDLLTLLDFKNNDLSIKGKELHLLCKNGHQRKIELTRFMYAPECPECLKNEKIESYNEKVSGYLDQKNFQYLRRGNRKTEFSAKCSKGHEFTVLFNNFKKNNTCPICYHEINGYSLSEKEIVQYIKSIYSGEILENNREIIYPKELDVFIPEKNLAIEYSGLYFHSILIKGLKEAQVTHRYKYDKCLDKGIKLITIFEDEWLYNKDICKSRIKNALGISEKIYARTLQSKIITKKQAEEFLEKNHLQGYGRSKIAFGLVDKNENIYAVLTLGNITRQNTVSNMETIELKRFASVLGYNILGGFSKLLKQAILWSKSQGYNKIRTHCDLRWGTGNVYKINNFKLIHETKYTPHYFKRLDRYRNMTLKKTPEERLLSLTELELRIQQGYNVIYDCGHSTWELDI